MAPKRILIVEDNLMNLELATDLLEAAGYYVLHAPTAREGIDTAKTAAPDAILMDIDLPDMNGLEATRLLKADPLTRDIPVAALSAFAMKEDRDNAREAGCVGYLTKPIDTRKFAGMVAELILQGDETPCL